MGAIATGILQKTRASAPRTAAEIAAALCEAREYTLGLYAHLDEAQQRFPRVTTVNPPRWEVGHLGWFQEFWCRRYSPDDPAGARTPSRLREADAWLDSRHVAHDTRWDLPLPDWDGIRAYLAATLDDTLTLLARSRDGARYFFELALYHEDMHGEALLITLDSLGLPRPPGVATSQDGHVTTLGDDVTVAGGTHLMGAAPGEEVLRFVFDNEQFAHEVRVEAFAIARRCVSEVEFATFVDDDGYSRPQFWSDAGNRWRATAGRNTPAHWRRSSDGGFEVRCFDRWRNLDPRQSVHHVNAYEAEAWCAWAGRRLPTEAEWEKAATDGLLATSLATSLAASLAPSPQRVWEWTATPFAPFPNFVAGPYAEYSAPWFHDHRVLRGGSWATPRRLAHPKFRNFYLPERHDPFAGFRSCAPG